MKRFDGSRGPAKRTASSRRANGRGGLLSLTLAAGLFGSACDANSTGFLASAEVAAPPVTAELPSSFTMPGNNYPHSGVRFVRSLRWIKNKLHEVAYREEVDLASNGAFRLECIEPLVTSMVDSNDFFLAQARHEGFLHRYRDFRVYDQSELLQNYVVLDPQTTSTVAGRTCSDYVVARKIQRNNSGPQITWNLAVDDVTGLVLRWSRHFEGVVTDEGEYEQITVGEPAPFPAHVPAVVETLLPSTAQEADLERILGFDITIPKILPDGFGLHEYAKVVEPGGKTWLKAVYTDGVEVAFYLFSSNGEQLEPIEIERTPKLSSGGARSGGSGFGVAPPSTVGQGRRTSGASGSGGTGGGTTGTSGSAPAGPSAPPVFVAVSHGDIVAMEFDSGSYILISVGRITLDDAQWMIESALP